jgi:hypothetical protein
MAKPFASETVVEIALARFASKVDAATGPNMLSSNGFREAPLTIVGEGANEIQMGVIAKQLVKRGHWRSARLSG